MTTGPRPQHSFASGLALGLFAWPYSLPGGAGWGGAGDVHIRRRAFPRSVCGE